MVAGSPSGSLLDMVADSGGPQAGCATYYVGRQTVIANREQAGMALWREMIFAVLNRNSELTADYFCIPATQVVEIGSSVEI